MRLALTQLNPIVGDIAGNASAIRERYAQAVAGGAQLVAAGELALTGYPPEDLVLKSSFVSAVADELSRLAAQVGETPLVVGFVESMSASPPVERGPLSSEALERPGLANAAAVLRSGAVESVYRKQRLPNYGVFDEARYFRPGNQPLVVEAGGARVGITICEDLWGDGGPVEQAAEAGAQLILNINASPYARGKPAERQAWAARHARAGSVWLAYLNQVGGQDEVVFDGDSFVMTPAGEVVARGAQFAEDLMLVDLPMGQGRGGAHAALAGTGTPRLAPVAEVRAALVLGTRDYVRKNGFRSALVGLSGGIDSALVAALAAEALGADAVTAVGMPSPYSSAGSLTDAKQLVANLGIRWLELPIERIMSAFADVLAEPFAGAPPGLAEENIQSRIRGALLMALSNKRGDIVLATGNKSEYAVGYSTLYGDMAGGFAVIKDVPKTLVYELCRDINSGGEVVPQAILDKPPSAELRPDQRDTDSLPPYDVLDPILEAYVEQDLSIAEIIASGFEPEVVRDVAKMVDRAEYKRRQAAPGVKITRRAFGKDRRVPITQSWSG
ncbi:MAG TPA: NAD+ synthase [Egibacteraceae bacterium]|nr:NAD+ synthase [Egibacteraceae bacterium]